MAGAGVVASDHSDAGSATAYATWFAALDDASAAIFGFELPSPPPLNAVTVRQIVHTSLGGDAFRIRFSNEYGDAPVTFSKVSVAKSQGDAAIDPNTIHVLTFAGSTAVTLQPKATVWSDDIAMPIESQADLAVNIYVADEADVTTEHRYAQRTNYIAYGDATSEPDIVGVFDTTEASYWMNEIDVLRAEPASIIVAFGDSITDGNNSTPGANLRYPDRLSELQLHDGMARSARSIVNAGIGGNRWLHGGLGPGGAERFSRDVLEVAGVHAVMMMMGINDIGFGVFSDEDAVTLDQLTTAISGAIAQARDAKLRVLLGTLPPFGACLYYTDAGEVLRQALNSWILSNKAVDGVVDFDRLLRDPSSETMYAPEYDSGDHLHPNDAGYLVMAKHVDLALKSIGQ